MTRSADVTERVTESVTKTDVMHGGAPRQSTIPPDSVRRESAPRSATTDTIAMLAAQSTGQADFLQRLAAELAAEFSAKAAAIMHPVWDAPLILATDAEFADRIEMISIGELLSRATTAASACDVPLRVCPQQERPLRQRSNPVSPQTTKADSPQRTRGLSIRLVEGDSPIALLLVFGDQDIPDTSGQVRDLKRLGEYADRCRPAMLSFANADGVFPTTSESSGEATASSKESFTRGFRRTLRQFHNDLDPTRTAYRIANEARRLLAVDRVTVLLAGRKQLRVEAVSGVAVVDRRSNAVASCEAFARRVIVLGRPVELPTRDSLPPQIDDHLLHYLDENDVASVTVIPIFRPFESQRCESDAINTSTVSDSMYSDDRESEGQPIAVVLLESFSEHHTRGITTAMREIAAESAVALANSLEHRRIFGVSLLKTLGDWFGGRNLPYTVIGTIGVIGLLAASMIIQVDHKIIATGFAEPSVQQNVFARTDGVVKEILVRDGQHVAAGDVLVRLENADLDGNAETLSGKIQTTSRRLASIDSLLLDPATDEKQAGRMAIEQRQLKSELVSLQGQLGLIHRQISELEIKAPINGIVAGWQLKRKLANRPVGRGNHLLTVVRADGPWQLRLEIADQDAADINRVYASHGKLDVEFAAASHPESTFPAVLNEIATSARRNHQGINVVDATASITAQTDAADQPKLEPFALSDARIGVEATAKITCDRRSLLNSWFGEVGDFINRNVLFYFR